MLCDRELPLHAGPWALHRAAAANKAGAVRRLLRDGDWIDDQQDDEVRLH